MQMDQMILAAGWLGVVFGSLIIKKENNNKLPVLMDCIKKSMGQPKYIICLANNKAANVPKNARLTSNFCTRVTTINPKQIIPKNNTILLPHCPGLIHASPVK